MANRRYEVYGLEPSHDDGANILAATVWKLGTFAPVAQISNRTAFLVCGESQQEQTANTNDSWLAEEEPGFQVAAVSMGELRGYFAADPIEKIDGRIFDWTWDAPVTAPARWKKAQPLGPAADRGLGDTPNNWQLIRDPLPGMEWRGTPGRERVKAAAVTANQAC